MKLCDNLPNELRYETPVWYRCVWRSSSEEQFESMKIKLERTKAQTALCAINISCPSTPEEGLQIQLVEFAPIADLHHADFMNHLKKEYKSTPKSLPKT